MRQIASLPDGGGAMPFGLDLETLKRGSRLFDLLDDAGRAELIATATEESVPAGAVLMQEGETGDTFYLVLAGEVAVSLRTLGESREVARLGTGSFVGEIAALMAEDRSATVTTTQETRVIRFEASPVAVLLKRYPKVREAITKLALQRSEANLQELLRE